MIRGIRIKLINRTETGIDAFNRTIYQETESYVDDVLISPEGGPEQANDLNMTGRKAKYMIGIPKGDTNEWIGAFVEFFGHRFRVVGEPTEGIEKMIPLRWNKKVQVEMADGEG